MFSYILGGIQTESFHYVPGKVQHLVLEKGKHILETYMGLFTTQKATGTSLKIISYVCPNEMRLSMLAASPVSIQKSFEDGRF